MKQAQDLSLIENETRICNIDLCSEKDTFSVFIIFASNFDNNAGIVTFYFPKECQNRLKAGKFLDQDRRTISAGSRSYIYSNVTKKDTQQ